MYDKYLDQFVPSKEMADYLKTYDHTISGIGKIIFYSARPIMEKYEALKEVGPSILASGYEYDIEDYNNFIKSIEMALEFKDAEGVFTVEVHFFDDETTKDDCNFESVCASYDDVVDFIQEDLEICETQPQDIHWFEVTKWVKNKQGKYVSACLYVFAHNELIGVEIDDDFMHEHVSYYGTDELNLPVPFKSGDIVEVDGYPYTPKKRLLIMEVGDNWDCCCLQGLFQEYDGKWKTAAVKHNWIGFETFPQMSPLYTMHTYTGPLEGNDAFLKEVSDWIAGDEEKASKLWDGFFSTDTLTTNEVRECMKRIDSKNNE